MSNLPTVIPASSSDVIAYLAMLGGQAEAGAEDRFKSSVDERKLITTLTMNKETGLFDIKIGGELVRSVKSVYATAVDIYGTRALWPPEADKKAGTWGKFPVCSVGFTDPNKLLAEQVSGNWLINEHYRQPYLLPVTPELKENVYFSCGRCPYNQFESSDAWEGKPEGGSKRKACQEGRTLFLMIMVKGMALPGERSEELYFFANDQTIDPFATLTVSYGSNRKPLETMAIMAAARRVPVTASVFKLSIDVVEPPIGFKYAQLDPEFAGVVDPLTYANVIKQMVEPVTKFAVKYSGAVVPDEDLSVPVTGDPSKTAADGTPIPF